METPQPEVIPYGHETFDPRQVRSVKLFFRTAVLLAFLPMTIGLAILGLYWLFEWEFLPTVGLFMLPIGGLLVLIGFAFAVTWILRERSIRRMLGGKARWGLFLGIVLVLLSNFGVAYFCAWAGSNLVFQPKVTILVRNESGARIDDCTLTVTGSMFRCGGIEAGATTIKTMKEDHFKDPHVILLQGGKRKDVLVTTGPAGANDVFTVTVQPNLEATTQAMDNRD